MNNDTNKIRNIGISAHIDSGKTTLTERILFYTNRIHAIHDVKGKDGVGATMDSMELEKERGITIASAATFCQWKNHEINIIDTPGHVDFTIEVERSLRVLDGAILVLCAVGGVQSQSITVDTQMKRYNVPRVAFVNKCDRNGANPFKVIEQLKDKLGHNAVAMQIPVGLEAKFEGVVDLVCMKAFYFDGENGETVREDSIPEDLLLLAKEKREDLIDVASMFSDDLMEAALDDVVTEELLIAAVRTATLQRAITPVFIGSAYKNKGVQPLLNAVEYYLPCPSEVENKAISLRDEEDVLLSSLVSDSVVALAFKLEDGQYGQLTYIRVYQGSISKGDTLINARTMKKVKIGRLIRMHADQMEDIDSISAGYIGALFGVDCSSGDTLFSKDMEYGVSMTSMFVPEPVISLAIMPLDNSSQIKVSKALNRFTKEDPTFRASVDHATNETIIEGMGELHLEVYIERIRREYKASVETGKPQVAYKETITRKAEFDYIHKKQTGGAGQYGRVAGYMEPVSDKEFNFENKIKGGSIPTQYISSCEKGFLSCMGKGPMMQFPVTGVNIVINDGASHAVDSSEKAFTAASQGAFRAAYSKAKPVINEPIMKVVVEMPTAFQGTVMGLLNQRRGIIVGAQEDGKLTVVESQVPLAEMFGFSTFLRSSTQGQAQFTMEFSSYKKVPESLVEQIKLDVAEKKKNIA